MTPDELPPYYVKRITVDQDTLCWQWTGMINRQGYAVDNTDAPAYFAARTVWTLAQGTEPDTISHTCHRLDQACRDGNDCRHRACVNPEHMADVTKAEAVELRRFNQRALCNRGHELTGDNVLTATWKGHADARKCKTCDLASRRTRYAAQTPR